MLTEAQLRAIMPNLPASKAALYLPHLNAAMAEYGIETMLRTAAFAAQLAHESGEFRWMEEIWGPTAAQTRYEPVTDLSQRLGNTQPGDGKRFKGRGPIQITGRFNYQKFGSLLGLDLIAAPERAATPEAAFRIAALYWRSRGLNELADAQNFREITRRINGGFNGLADRQKYYALAKRVLASGFEAAPVAATRGVAPPAARGLPQEEEPLARGFEAIRELAPRRSRAKPPAGRKAPTRKRSAARKAAGPAATAKKVKRQPVRAARRPATKAAARKAGDERPAAPSKATAKRAGTKPSTAANRAVAMKRAAKKPVSSASAGKSSAHGRAASRKATVNKR